MTHLTFIRYFVPDSNEFAPGWYQTRNEGRTRIGDVPLSLSDALYDGPNRVIIDDNTPETNSLPVSGGKGVDEFLITRTANSVVIDDDSGANVIVFERDVVITSIERQAGSEGASVAQYVITLSSGKTITLRNPASFTFQHLGDATRTAPISAEDFFTAYEDGFAASDASHPDIIGDASGPSGVQGPMITGTATGAVYEGDLSTSGDLDVNDDDLLASTTPFTISTQGTYGTASIGDDGEWVYKLDNGNTDVRLLNSGDTLTDTFVVNVTADDDSAQTQTITITISGRTDVWGTNSRDSSLGDASTSDNQAIFGFNSGDVLRGGSGDDLLVGGYGIDDIDLSAGGADTVVYRINSSDGNGLVKAEDGGDTVMEFTPGEDKLVILDVNGSPTTLAGLFDSLTKDAFRLRFFGDTNGDRNLSSSELDAGARYLIQIVFDVSGTDDGGPTSGRNGSGHRLIILFDRVTSEALNDRAVWDTLTGGTNFSSTTILDVAQLSSLFGGFGRPGYDAALDDGGFISIIGPDDLPDSYFEFALYEGDLSTSGDLDVNDDTLLDSTTPFTISTQGTYGTASIGDDGEWVYKLDNGNTDVKALNSGDTLTDTFVVDVNLASGRAKTQTVTITISGRTDVFGTNGGDSLKNASTSDNQAIFGFNFSDFLTGGSGDDLLVGGYGFDFIDLRAGGTDTVVFRINSSDTDGRVKAEDGFDDVRGFTSGEDKLVILDVNGSPTTLAGLFDSLTKDAFQLRIDGDGDRSGDLSSSELDAGARYAIQIEFQSEATADGGSGRNGGSTLIIYFDRVTSEALNDMAVWDTLTGGTNFSSNYISTVAQLSSLFGGFGRPGYDAALDDGGFISVIGPDDLPSTYFEIVPISGDETGSVTEGGAPGDDNTGTLTASGTVITLVSKETTDSPGTSTGAYGVMTFDGTTWTYTLDDRAEALADQQTATETFIFSGGGATFEVTITITGANDAPVVESGNEIVQQAGRVGQEITAIDLSGLFTDVDTGDTFTLTVMVLSSDGNTRTALDTLGLEYDSGTKMITGTLLNSVAAGPYTIEVIATDGSGGESQPSTFDIVVAPDIAPVIGGAVDGTIAEDAADPVTGTLTITDAEGDPLPTVELTDGAGQYGTLTFVASAEGGVWTYTLDNANADVQALKGDTLTEEFTFTAEGATPITVTITISGVNDAPVVETEIVGQTGRVGQEIKAIDLSGLFTDVDAGDSFTLTVMVLSSDGNTRMALDTTLGLEYDSDTKMITGTLLNSVVAGTYTIEVIATDGGGRGAASQPSTFNIVVAPDNAPVIGGAMDGTIAEDAADPLTGTLTITDAEGDPLPTVELTDGAGQYGTLTFVASAEGGVWTYTLNNANADVQALKGDTLTEEFTFTAEGATPITVTITISGVNDVPVVETEIVGQSGRVGQEITAIDLSGLFTDVDAGDSFTLTVMVLSSDGNTRMALDTTLGLEYDSDTKMITGTLLNSVVAGTYTIEVIATDGGGRGAASQPSTFNIVVALDNAPVIGGAVDGSIDEDAADPITGTLTITDADNDALPTVALTNGAGQYGTLTFVASGDGGVWTYTLDNTNADVQALKGDTLTEEFTFTAEGADDITVTITISGVNDAPVVESEIVGQSGRVGQEITAIDLSGLFTDVDTGDTFTLTVMVLSSDGNTRMALGTTLGLEYDSDTKMITGTLLDSIPTGPYTIEVIATDGGGAASQPSTFDIVVVADGAPVIGGAVDGMIAEDAADPITGTLTITDAEGDAVPTVALTDGAGQYGTLTFTASEDGGVWTYTLDNNNAAVQALKGGTLEDNFTFTAEGAAPITVTITISGVNDVPVVESGNEIGEQAGRVGQEITAIDLSGLFTDVDTGDSFTLTVMVLSSDGSPKSGLDTLGLEYDSDTKMITGTLLNSVVAGPYTIEVIATDGGGRGDASQPSTFDIVVAPDNAPVIGGAVDGTIDEDAVDSTGTLTITDADNDALPTVELSSGAGQYGTLTFVASADGGVWTYELNNANADVQALKGGTLEDNFTFTAEGADPITVTITISGVNDAPVVETEIVGQTGRVGQEITAIDLSSLFTDVDAGDTFTLAVMVLSSDGNTRMALGTTLGLEYDSDTKMITGTLLNSVVAGTYTIEVIATDGSGDESQPSTFDIVVAPDIAPVIGGAMDGTIAEDVADPLTGTLTITDAEGDPLPTVELSSGAGQYGTLTFVASAEGGVWTYTLDNANADVQALKGDTLTEEFTFTAEGATPITVTITISGVNDVPVVETEIVGQTGRVGQEITAIDLSGLFTDVDAGDTFTLAVMVLSSDGNTRMALDTTLGLEYDSDTKMITGTLLNSVVAGTYTIEVIATDGGGSGDDSQPSTFNIVVAPDNAPVIGGAMDGTIAEDAADPLTGTLTITDADDDALPTVALPDGAGQYGTLTFVASAEGGVWTYELNNANADVQALKGGTLEDNFTFTAEGADPITVTITISGVNDAPVVETEIVGQTGRVGQEIEAIDLSSLFTDVDTGDSFTLTVMVLSSDGNTRMALGTTLGLEYDSDTKMITGTLLNSVVAGTYTIEVIATDGGGRGDASQPSTFDIVVAPDNAPVIGGAMDGTIAEDAVDPITGTLTITDAEGDPLPTVELSSGAGQYGTLTFVASAEGGVWTYTLDNTNAAVQALGKDDTLTEEFTFTAEGATPITVTITISGVNDVPVVETEIVGQAGRVGQEITAIDLSGLFTDVDAGDSFTLTVMVLSSDGNTRMALDTTLGLEYDSDTKMITGTLLNSVVAGTYTIEVIATDGGGRGADSQPSTFNIVVAPDNAPVIGGAMDGTIAEDAADPLTGTLTITDADDDALPTVALTNGAGQYGTLTFVASAEGGVWTYELNNANADVQALKGGTLEDNFTFTAEGADPITVTITISGVNDAPVVETEIVGQFGRVGQEITAIDLSGLFTDVDAGDSFTLTVMVLSSDGNTRMALDTTLGLEYDSDTKMITGTLLDSIPTGPYTIEVIATDGGGSGAASQPSTFNIVVALDNAPVIGGAVDGSIDEDAADPITGTLTITDADDDPLPTVALTNGAGQYGTLTFVASADGGVWTYTLDNTNADVQALKDDTLEDNFTFTAEGAAPITVTITISGVNDAPTVSGEFFTRVGATGGQFTLSNLSDRFTDVDEGDELTFEVTLDDDRPLSTIGLSYNSDDDEITGTLTGTGTYVIKIVATDKSGATVEATFELNIFSAIPIIQRNSLTYNPDETSITIDETMLKVTSGNESDPTLLVYTITTLPDAGMLLKNGIQLNKGDTFTQADINNGLITYVPSVSDPSTSQSNPLSFTISDGVATPEEKTLEITSREVVGNTDADEDNLIDLSIEIVPQKIEAGDGSDTIAGGQKDDQIDGGAGDDEIKLTRTVNNVEEVDAGADEVLYEFGYDGVGIDGGDEIVGFKRGQDKLTFVIDRNFDSLTAFLESLNGADETDLTADDAFIVTMMWGLDAARGAFYFDSVLLHFKDVSAFGVGRVSSPLVTVTFDERLDFDGLVEILGGAENIANNFDFTHAAFKNLDEVLPRLFGEGSIGFKGVAPSGTNGASERASEEPLEPPVYETLSEQHDDDLQPTSFELGGGEPDII